MATKCAAILIVEVCNSGSNTHSLPFSTPVKQVASRTTNPNVLIVLFEEIEISAQFSCQRNNLLFVIVRQRDRVCVLDLQSLLLFLQVC